MLSSLQKKLRLKEGMSILTVSAPTAFAETIGAADAGIIVGDKTKKFEQIHWFVKNKKEVDTGVKNVLKLLTPGIICWIYYPKGSSKLQTDLTRDVGWEALMKEAGIKWLTLISFDVTWSAFSVRLETGSDKKEKEQTKPRLIVDYIDPVKKIVKVPDDLQAALNKNKEVATFFNQLAFSHKKEYVEWIVTAKKEETRKTRIEGTIERLLQKWKNPRNL